MAGQPRMDLQQRPVSAGAAPEARGGGSPQGAAWRSPEPPAGAAGRGGAGEKLTQWTAKTGQSDSGLLSPARSARRRARG